jgi:transcriptional regulator with XRE-family HTH domain
MQPPFNPPPDEQSSIRTRLRLQRRELGLSQLQVADAIGFSRLIYHRIETGNRRVYFDDFAKLETIFDLETILNPEQLKRYRSIANALNNSHNKVNSHAQNL